jgi:hypothetical protein
MNNEPVAWMYEKPNGASKLSFVKEKMLWEDMTETPLYTHPVKELTMTDDEAMDLWNEQSSHPVDFARAILRKAQDK